MKCKICGNESCPHQRGVVLGRYDVQFFRCPSCGFVQTEDPFWLEESYSSAINRLDVGYVSRNVAHARMVHALIALCFNPRGKFIDFGGGYGMFVRMMRDLGFDFYWKDKYCQNLFAAEHIADTASTGKFELLTAFEVFEHLRHPLGDIDEMLKVSDSVLFSTGLIPDEAPPLDKWIYYGLDHGQHIAFYSRDALRHIAQRHGMRLLTHGGFLHLFTRKNISAFRWKLALNRYSKLAITLLYRQPTLLWQDSDQVLQSVRASKS